MHESYLHYRGRRWLGVALGVSAAAAVAYALTPPAARRGSSPVGLVLGVAAAALMLWLTWLGVRKRRYGAAGAPLRGWVSAHVYLGTTLVLLIPLHAAFHFAANVHALAAALAGLTVVSGAVGVACYAAIPERMTRNRPGERLAALFEQVGAVDAECTAVAAGLPTAVAATVGRSITATRIGGGPLRQLAGADPTVPTRRALDAVRSAQEAPPDRAAADALVRLRAGLTTKQALLRRIAVDVRLKALLDAWLVVHVPLAVASLAALGVHVFAVLYYR